LDVDVYCGNPDLRNDNDLGDEGLEASANETLERLKPLDLSWLW